MQQDQSLMDKMVQKNAWLGDSIMFKVNKSIKPPSVAARAAKKFKIKMEKD